MSTSRTVKLSLLRKSLAVPGQAVEVDDDQVLQRRKPAKTVSQKPVSEEVPALKEDGYQLLHDARKLGRLLGAEPVVGRPKYRQFSTADFPKKAGLAAVVSVWSGKVELTPRKIYQSNPVGPDMYKTTDGSGNSRCFQQRGDLNDTQSWRWHRVAASLCGHLR